MNKETQKIIRLIVLTLILITPTNAGEQTFEIYLFVCAFQDINGDGLITRSDLNIISAHFGEKFIDKRNYDVCADGDVDIFDAVSVSRLIVLNIP